MRVSLNSNSDRRRVLPVVVWLQAGAAAAAMGLSLAGAPAAGADDGGSAVSTRSTRDGVQSGPVRSAASQRRSVQSAAAAISDDSQPPQSRKSQAVPPAQVITAALAAPRTAAVTRSGVGLRAVGLNPTSSAPTARTVTATPAIASASIAPPVDGPSALSSASRTAASTADVLTSLATGFNTAMGQVFDAVANLLARFPAGPINDLLAGTVLLARRALFIPVQQPGAATVTSVNLPNVGTYGAGGEMKFVVNFNEQVDVTDTNVAVPVEMNYRLSGATYVSGSGTQSLLFSLKVPEYASAPNGVTVGEVDSTGARSFGFGNLIVDKGAPTVAVNSAIPTLDLSRVAVDALGPQITGRSNLTVNGQGVSLTVTFDRPVIVTGSPTVPVSIDGVDRLLTFSGGNRSSTLTFCLADPGVTSASFRPYTGDVIYLPDGTAGISDRLGNQIYTLEGDINTPLIENGNRMVVIGQHFERLPSLSAADLDSILNGTQPQEWYQQSTYGPPLYFPGGTPTPQPWPFLKDYAYPDFAATPATNGVDVYRVAFRSSIPEQQRYTTAYGLVAVPTDATGSIPVVEWQQATVFNLTYSAPSQAFSCGTSGKCPTGSSNDQSENVPPRLEVAQFAGKGYAVFMPDPFGLGNSAKYENYAYMVNDSITQNSTDMYNAGKQLFTAEGLTQSNLFLAGWSAGGNQSADWLQKIESQTIEGLGPTVDGVAIASSPLSLGPAVRNAIFNPRTWTPQNTGDASWLDVTVGFTAFSLGGYQGQPTTAFETLGKYYEVARRLYTGQYTLIKSNPKLGITGNPDFGLGVGYVGPYWGPVTNPPNAEFGITLTYTDVNGQTQSAWMPYSVAQLIAPTYSSDPVAYDNSSYAELMNANGSGQVAWVSPVYMQYGNQDEVLTPTMGMSVYSWQQQAYGKQNISFVTTNAANHVGNYLQALQNDLTWFNSIRAQN